MASEADTCPKYQLKRSGRRKLWILKTKFGYLKLKELSVDNEYELHDDLIEGDNEAYEIFENGIEIKLKSLRVLKQRTKEYFK